MVCVTSVKVQVMATDTAASMGRRVGVSNWKKVWGFEKGFKERKRKWGRKLEASYVLLLLIRLLMLASV